MNFYETDRAVAEYLLFHYGSPEEVLPYDFGPLNALNFPARCISECLEPVRLSSAARALDLGCAVGRATFELARHCREVSGIDYSQRFIEAAGTLQQCGSIEFEYVEEGDCTRRSQAVVPRDIDRQRVHFERGDAMYLRDDFGTFEVVLMANLIDRLSAPRRCLQQLPALMKPGGQLIITSPYTWLEEYTPRENWLGGFEHDGQRIRTLDTLKIILGHDFGFSFTKDLPFLIREHARKFQWSVAEASVWVRK
ncbi:MAG: putative 4-mercaptohistidine N1-methyltransferase [Verrucomicrobia bacterium]|nr:putative 4-mercaptohistidine N1-methyltransferase [Verrucomicrobiota bacterium]